MSFLPDYSLGIALGLCVFEFLYFVLKFNVKTKVSREDYNRVLYSFSALIVSAILFTSYSLFNQYNVLDKLNVVGNEFKELGENVYRDFISVAIIASIYGCIVETISLIFLIISFISSSPFPIIGVGVAKLSYRSVQGIALAGTFISQNIIMIGQFFTVLVFIAGLLFPFSYFIGIGLLPLKNTRPLGISLILFSLAIGIFLPYIFYSISSQYDFIRKRVDQSPPKSLGWMKIVPMLRIPVLVDDKIVWKNFSCPKYTSVRFFRNIDFMNGSIRESFSQYLVYKREAGKYVRYVLVPSGNYTPIAMTWSWLGFPVDYNFSNSIYVNSSRVNEYSLDYLMNVGELKPQRDDKIYSSIVFPKPYFQDGFKVFAEDRTVAHGGVCDFSSGWFVENFDKNIYVGILDPRYVSPERVNVTYIDMNVSITLENGTTITRRIKVKKTTVTIEVFGHYNVLKNISGRSFVSVKIGNVTYMKYFDCRINLSETWTKYENIGLFDFKYKKYDPFKFFLNTINIVNGSDIYVVEEDCLFNKIVVNKTFLEDFYQDFSDNIDNECMLIVKTFDIPLIEGYRDAIHGIINITYIGNISTPARIFVEVINPHTRFAWGDEYLQNCYYCWNKTIVWLYSCEGAPSGVECKSIYDLHNLTYFLPLEYDELNQFLFPINENPLYRDLKLLVEDHAKIYGLMIQIFTILIAGFMVIDFLSGLFGGISISGLTYLGIVKKTKFYSYISQAITSSLYSFLDIISRKTSLRKDVGYRALRNIGLSHVTALSMSRIRDEGRFLKKVEKYYLDKIGKMFYSIYKYGIVFHRPLSGLIYIGYRAARKSAEKKGSPLLYTISEKFRTMYFLSTRKPLDLLIFSTILGAKTIRDKLKSMEKLSELARIEKKIIEELSQKSIDFRLKYRALKRFYEGYVYNFPFKLKSYRDFLRLYDRYASYFDNIAIQFYEKKPIDFKKVGEILDKISDSVSGQHLSQYFKNINMVSMKNYVLFRTQQLLLGGRNVQHLSKYLDEFHKQFIDGFAEGVKLTDRDVSKYIGNIYTGKNVSYSLGILKAYYLKLGREEEFDKLLNKVEGRWDLLRYIPFKDTRVSFIPKISETSITLDEQRVKMFKNYIFSGNFEKYSLPHMLAYLRKYYEEKGEPEKFDKLLEIIEGRYDLLQYLPYDRYPKVVEERKIPEEILLPAISLEFVIENLRVIRGVDESFRKADRDINRIVLELQDLVEDITEPMIGLKRGYGSDLLRREYVDAVREALDKHFIYRDRLRSQLDVLRLKFNEGLRFVPPELRNEYVSRYKPILLKYERVLDEINYRIKILYKVLEEYGGGNGG